MNERVYERTKDNFAGQRNLEGAIEGKGIEVVWDGRDLQVLGLGTGQY